MRYVLTRVTVIVAVLLWFGFLAFLCYAQLRQF